MQDRRTNSYSNLKTQLEIDLEEEHQALLEDQKLCRIRAQKLSIETNRRRKALEGKHREEEEKEQRFREEILQQRKLKVQEATEKFQRAHLPPSLRRRSAHTGHKKTIPKLEDALDQIQGSISSTVYYLANNKNSTNTRTTDTPSTSSTLGNRTWYNMQQPVSKLGFERIFQEKSVAHFDSNQLYFQHKLEEAQRLLEEHHLSNLQNFHQEVEQLAHSESVSSLDSLEEETEAAASNAPEEFTSNNLHKALSALSPFSENNTAAETPFRPQYLNESLSHLNGHNNTSMPSHQIVLDKLVMDKHLHNKDQILLLNRITEQAVTNPFTQNGTTRSESTPSSSTQKEDKYLSKMNTIVPKAAFTELGYRESMASNVMVRPSKAWATPDPTAKEAVEIYRREEHKEPIHQTRISIKPTVGQLLATPVVLPCTESERFASSCHDGIGTSTKKSKYSEDLNALLSIGGTDSLTSTNNAECYSMKNDHHKCEPTTNQESLLHGNASQISSTTNTGFGVIRDQKEDHLRATLVHAYSNPGLRMQYKKARNNIAGKDGNRLLKSILKKDSKYENGYFRAMGISRTLHCGNKSTAPIRDSVELTKEKHLENLQTCNKKLRWLDEIDKIMVEKEATDSTGIPKSQSSTEHTASMNKNNSNPRVPKTTWAENYQGAPASMLIDRLEPSIGTPNSVFSTGYHFIKQAWVLSKGEEISPAGYNHNSKIPPKGKTKLVRRPKSAKQPLAFVHRNRKGTIIRPQSATEASKILKSQGKFIMPHPPPRPISGYVNSHNIADTMNQPVNSDIPHIHNSSNVVLPPNQVFTKDSIESTISSQSSAYSSGDLMPHHPYKSPEFEPATKSIITLNNEQTFVLQETLPTPTKRYPVYGENGLRLDRTPTDEEINSLWHGVRSALTHKNAGAGDFRPGDLPSNLQPTRPNLSHVVIDGGNLLNNLNSISRMNGFFSPPANGHITLARRKQNVDSSENKRRALLEQRRCNTSFAGWRPQHTQNLHAVKISPFPSAFEPGPISNSVPNSNEVSESTAQFMLAENLVETSVAEGEILAAMQALQANRQSFLMHKAQHIGLNALSLEEQKLLQSLDRLNQRLQHVQEAIIKNPTATSGFPIKSPLSIQQFVYQPADTSEPSRRLRSLSADPRTRLQRRY